MRAPKNQRLLKIIHRSSILLIFGLLLASHLELMAQDEVDNQLWLDYNLRVDLQERTSPQVHSIGGDAGIRGFISNQEWNQFYIRPTYTYRLRRIANFALAAAYFGTFNADTTNSHELRFHQDIFARFPDNEYFAIFYRVRLEQRLFYYEGGNTEQSLRIRFLIGIESPDIRLGQGRRPFYFQFFWESFRTLFDESAGEVFINQARPTFIFSHRLSPSWRYEINFVPQRSRSYSDEGLETTQNLFRLRVFHRIFKNGPGGISE